MKPAKFNKIETILLTCSASIFCISFFIYFTGFSFWEALFESEGQEGKNISIAALVDQSGIVRRQKLKENTATRVSIGGELYHYDLITTGEESAAHIQFDNGSTAQLGSNSMAQLSFDSKESHVFENEDQRAKILLITGKVELRTGRNSLITERGNRTEIMPPQSERMLLMEIQPTLLKKLKKNPLHP